MLPYTCFHRPVSFVVACRVETAAVVSSVRVFLHEQQKLHSNARSLTFDSFWRWADKTSVENQSDDLFRFAACRFYFW